jgi:hypothetical protein
MSLSSLIFSLFGFHVGPTDAERLHRHQEWRDAVHQNRNEVLKAIGSATQSKLISNQALASLKEAVRTQESDGVLRRIELALVERLRGDNVS